MNILDKIKDISIPVDESTTFPILYTYTSKNQPQQWQIFVDGDTFYTEEGIVGGTITRSKPTTCKPKNIGKVNQTTGEQQALLEARAKHQKKLDKHYNEVLSDERSFYEPMLAHTLEDHTKHLFTVPTFIQPKYDGVRAISRNGELTSRGGKHWVSCPHLLQDEVVLDGELYNHDYNDNFEELISMFRKQKPTPEMIAKTAQYGELWAYDFPAHIGVFSERYAALKSWHENFNMNPMVKLVPTYQIHNMEELEAYHTTFLEEGYEGSIIRLDLDVYEHKRTKQVLKYKVWIDDEFEVVGFTEAEGNKAGMVGKVLLRLHDGKISGGNLQATHAFSTYVWNNQQEFIGKKATVKFQNYTDAGMLRIAYVKVFDRASYETV